MLNVFISSLLNSRSLEITDALNVIVVVNSSQVPQHRLPQQQGGDREAQSASSPRSSRRSASPTSRSSAISTSSTADGRAVARALPENRVAPVEFMPPTSSSKLTIFENVLSKCDFEHKKTIVENIRDEHHAPRGDDQAIYQDVPCRGLACDEPPHLRESSPRCSTTSSHQFGYPARSAASPTSSAV